MLFNIRRRLGAARRAEIIPLNRQRRLGAAGLDREEIQNRQDQEELALIRPWREDLVGFARLKLAKMLVRARAIVTLLMDACRSFWVFCKSYWNLRNRVPDLEERLSNAIHGRNGWRRRFLQMLRLRNECKELHHHAEDQIETIRGLERQRNERKAAYDELLGEFRALRQASTALILAGGPARTTEKLLRVSVQTRDLHRKQIQTLVASLKEAGAEIATLKDKVKTLEEDLQTVNDGRATMLWRDTAKENIELRRQAHEEILERDMKIRNLRDHRDESAVTSLSLDSRGQQILRKLQENLISAEDKLAHFEMIVEKSNYDEVKYKEEKEQIKMDALYGESERLGELYTNAVIEANELNEELKRFEFSTDPEYDIEAVQRHCNEEKEKLKREIADKNRQISTFKAQIDHAMGSINWADNRFAPLDKYFGFIPGAKEEIRRLSTAIEQGLEMVDQTRYLENLTIERDRLLDEMQNFRAIQAELLQNKTQNETELVTLRDRVARRNTQVTNLKTRNTNLQAQLIEAQAVVPPLGEELKIAGIAAPVMAIYVRNLLALEKEIRERGREIPEYPSIPGFDGVGGIEREPIEISVVRICDQLKVRFHDLSRMVRECDPPCLGATDDWVDDNTDSPENLNARRLGQILRLKDLWGYIGTLHFDTILFVHKICRNFGIEPDVELPEKPQSPSPSPSPTPSPPSPRSRDGDLFPATFTHYEVFDIERWNVFPHDQENITPALSVISALQLSIQEQLPDHDAGYLEPIAYERHLVGTIGRNITFLIDPIHERQVAEALYRINHSFVLRTVTQFPRRNGGSRYLSREILYPNTLEVPPPRTVVVLYLSGNCWQGMSLKPVESDNGSENGLDGRIPTPELESPVLMEFDLTDWKIDYVVERWKVPGQAVMREGLFSISAVASSLHWQYPGVLWNNIAANEAYENLFERFQRVHPHYEGDYLPEHIQAVLEGILGDENNRPHYRLATITPHEIADGDVRCFVSIYGGESDRPLLYVSYNPGVHWRGMRRMRAGDSKDVIGDLEWCFSVQQLPVQELPANRMIIDEPIDTPPILPATILPRNENYGMNSIKVPFNQDGWTFDIDLEHFNEGLRRCDNQEPWIHGCAPRALYHSIHHQYPDYMEGNLTLETISQAFDDVFPRHENSWKVEEVARVLGGHPALGGYELAIVNCSIYDDRTIVAMDWSQPQGYSPASGKLLYVAAVNDLRVGYCQEDNRHHWTGMKYRDVEAVPNPRLFTPQPAVPLSKPSKSRFMSLLNAATSNSASKKIPAPKSSASTWSNFDSSQSFVSQSGQKWVPPSTGPSNVPINMIPSSQMGKQFGTAVQQQNQLPPPSLHSASSSFKVKYWSPFGTTAQQQQQPGSPTRLNPYPAPVPFGEFFIQPTQLQQQPPQPSQQGQNAQKQVSFGTNTVSKDEQLELARKLQAEQGRGNKHSRKDKESKRTHGADMETGMGRENVRGRGRGRARKQKIGRGSGRGDDGGGRGEGRGTRDGGGRGRRDYEETGGRRGNGKGRGKIRGETRNHWEKKDDGGSGGGGGGGRSNVASIEWEEEL
ncbi:hypothetical protein BcDW1_7520 [Botrytis cinerea BcDW1]|uniref:Uncharacterized protein n=1 Tax=Botryotinia fuckeliana (strain BcDW1) TaxID=1290391 RepID=M7UB78_BOTF1|nr:hypothetical protein BcDW1_7520 [Botrytis cinerea BcDW1]